MTPEEADAPPPNARFRLACALGRAAGQLSRRLGRGEGGVVSGRICLGVDPLAGARLVQGTRVAVVSGTNGKTTTTAMLTAALRTAGPVRTNATGANLPGGIVGGLLDAPETPVAVVEADELIVPWTVKNLAPEVIALLNLSRDQLDRLHEVQRTADVWRRALEASSARVVANADDPLVVWAAEGSTTTWVALGQPWTVDATTCSKCGHALDFTGPWHCPGCGRARPNPEWSLEGDDLVDAVGARVSVVGRLPGRVNRANAAAAIVAAHQMGVAVDAAAEAVRSMGSAAGRYEVVSTARHELSLLLAKNPAGWHEVLNLVDGTPVETPLVVALNARTEDGRDMSWIWDVDFERLRGRTVVASGERAADLSTRLRYADVAHEYAPSAEDGVDLLPPGPVTILANYSAFRQLRRAFAHA